METHLYVLEEAPPLEIIQQGRQRGCASTIGAVPQTRSFSQTLANSFTTTKNPRESNRRAPDNDAAGRQARFRITPRANAFMLGWQVGAKFDFPHLFYVQFAPTLTITLATGMTFNIHFSGQPPGTSPSPTPNQTGINSLLVFDIPAEIGWTVGKIPMRIFGDFATNFEADDRATAGAFQARAATATHTKSVSVLDS